MHSKWLVAFVAVALLLPSAVLAEGEGKEPDSFGNGPAARATGGPDDYGYTFIDSTEAGGPTYSYIDISGTGTVAIQGYADDAVAGPFPIGFTFNFYGTDYTQFWVQTNGTIAFGDFSYDYSNEELPTDDFSVPFLAPMWDDLVAGDTPGQIIYETLGTAPNRYLVIQFHNVRWLGAEDSDPIEFEVILYEGSNDIVFQYADLVSGSDTQNYGASATIGIQGSSTAPPNYYLQYAYNPSGGIQENLAILFTTGGQQQPTPTPTPSAVGVPATNRWGLAAFAAAIAALALLMLRRR